MGDGGHFERVLFKFSVIMKNTENTTMLHAFFLNVANAQMCIGLRNLHFIFTKNICDQKGQRRLLNFLKEYPELFPQVMTAALCHRGQVSPAETAIHAHGPKQALN